jgi:RNA polymerase sigma-70 factor (ECF subfamily)
VPESTQLAASYFLTTHWSVVLRAAGEESETAHQALCDLCQIYWYPLYAYARRQGHSPHDAEDLIQGFFAVLVEKNFIGDADRTRGKFRGFLLTALKHFMANEWNRQHAKKRGGFTTLIQIDQMAAESRLEWELRDNVQPDAAFERQWASTLLDRVMANLEREYVESGRAKLFEALRDSLVRDESARPYADIAVYLKVSEAAVKMAVQRLRARYRELLRSEIARTVSSVEEIEPELRQLMSAFSR